MFKSLMVYKSLMVAAATISLAACGGSSSNDTAQVSSTTRVPVNFGLSDAPVEALTAVAVTVDTMVLTKEGGEEVVIDEFYNELDPGTPLSQIQINLLDFQGSDYSLIAQDLMLDVGTYERLTLEILDEDVTLSYAEEVDGNIKPIKVPSDTLKLGGFTVADEGVQTFIVEFDLRQAMTYNPGPERYILKPRGVSVVEAAASVSVSGTVDLAYFNALEPCASKMEANVGNVLYFYQGAGLDASLLSDQMDPSLGSNGITNEFAPYASVGLNDVGGYEVAYLPAGDYTLAFSCVAENDDPDLYDNLAIPAPEGALIEVSLNPGDSEVINFPVL